MSRHLNQDFLRGDPQSQVRALKRTGAGVLAVALVGTAVGYAVIPRATEPAGTQITVVVPALGTGLKEGSKVLMRGAEIGQVTGVDARDQHAVRMKLRIVPGDAQRLTDSFVVDFRPENYFGSTSVNVIAGTGGNAIREGAVYQRAKTPDYSMSTMIREASVVVDGTLTTSIVATLDKVMQYANGLAPLIHSGVIVADAVAKTQKQLPTALLDKANAVFAEFPQFNLGTMSSLYTLFDTVYNVKGADGARTIDREKLGNVDTGLEVAGSDLFSKIGNLLASHETDLLPVVNSVKLLSDPVPGMIGEHTMDQLIALITGARGTIGGTPEQPRLKVRAVVGATPSPAKPR